MLEVKVIQHRDPDCEDPECIPCKGNFDVLGTIVVLSNPDRVGQGYSELVGPIRVHKKAFAELCEREAVHASSTFSVEFIASMADLLVMLTNLQTGIEACQAESAEQLLELWSVYSRLPIDVRQAMMKHAGVDLDIEALRCMRIATEGT